MNISKLASILSKPLLSSVSFRVASALWASCRTITTGREHVRFGNSGQQGLDIYLGTWISDRTKCPHHLDVFEKLRLREHNIHPVEQFVAYSRDNATWTVENGLQGMGKSSKYTFSLGEPFSILYPDGSEIQVTISQKDVSCMVWSFTAVEGENPSVSKVETEVKDRTLLWKYCYDDGAEITIIYTRK